MEAVRQVIEEVGRSFIDRGAVLSLQQIGTLIYDGDLTGPPVSSTSTTYPGAAFGWMDDAVRLGYQAALVSLHSPTYGRLRLSVTPHPGDTVSCSQADVLVRAAEARTGARPMRRTDLLAERIRGQPSGGLGHRPFKAATGIRIPLGACVAICHNASDRERDRFDNLKRSRSLHCRKTMKSLD